MATPTCSSFLVRSKLCQFRGEYLLTAAGPYLELFSLDKFVHGIYDPDKDEPVRTRVFENADIRGCIPEFREDCSLIFGWIRGKEQLYGMFVQHETILKGGYADASSVFLIVDKWSCLASVHRQITGTNELVILDPQKLLHISFEFEEETLTCSMDIVEEFEIRSLLPSQLRNLPINSLSLLVDSGPISPQLTVLLSMGKKEEDAEIVLLKRIDGAWTLRTMVNEGSIWMGSLMDDGADGLGVVFGKEKTLFFTAGTKHRGVSKQQISVKKDVVDETGRRCSFIQNTHYALDAVSFTTMAGTRMLAVLTAPTLSLYTIDAGNVTQTRTFVHTQDYCKTEVKLGVSSIENRIRVLPAIYRRHLLSRYPEFIAEDPVAAQYLCAIIDSVPFEWIVITYECGSIKAFKLDDIVKSPETTTISFDIKDKTAKISCLNQCWSYPPPENPNLRLYSCLYNGFPAVILENGAEVSLKRIVNDTVYDRCCSGTIQFSNGRSLTRAVFYSKKAVISYAIEVSEDLSRILVDALNWNSINWSLPIDRVFVAGSCLVVAQPASLVLVSNSSKKDGCLIPLEGTTGTVTAVHARFNASELTVLVGFSSGELRYAKGTVTLDVGFEYVESELTLSANLITEDFGGIIGMSSSCLYGPIAVVTTQHNILYIEENMQIQKDFYNFFDCPKRSDVLLGFIIIESTKSATERKEILVGKSERTIFYKILSTVEDLECTRDPIPLKAFDASSPIFGHFEGSSDTGRFVLQTMDKYKAGEPLKLINLIGRLATAWRKESLTYPNTLNQPDKIVYTLPHLNPSLRYLVCAETFTINVSEIDLMGRVKFMKDINLKDSSEYLAIGGIDACVVQPQRTMYILTGSSNGTLSLTFLNLDSLIETTYHIIRDFDKIYQVSFFDRLDNQIAPQMCAVRSERFHRVVRLGYGSCASKLIFEEEYPSSDDFEKATSQLILIGTGDAGRNRFDSWCFSAGSLKMSKVSGEEIEQETVSLPSTFGRKLRSVCAVSAKHLEESWADFIFLVTETNSMGILARTHRRELFNSASDAAVIVEFPLKAAKNFAQQAELISAEFPGDDTVIAMVRLYVAKRRSIVMCLNRLRIDESGLSAQMTIEGKVPTSISDPSNLEIAKMTSPSGTAVRYAIISGAEGTQIVRICNKKLVDPLTVDWENMKKQSEIRKESIGEKVANNA